MLQLIANQRIERSRASVKELEIQAEFGNIDATCREC